MTEEQRARYMEASPSTDCSDEIKLMRVHIDELRIKIAAGEVSVPGMRGEVFLEDILIRKTAMLNSLLRSQHVMHPDAGNDGSMKLEITIKGGEASPTEEVKDLDDGNRVPEAEPGVPEAAPEEKEEAHSLEELFEDP